MIWDSIHSPVLLLDERKVRRNIRRMAEKARAAGVRFRPHFKTPQSAGVGEWFRDEGVSAITVSSVRMAEYFAQNGWRDITIAFPVNVRELPRLRDLGRRIHLNLILDHTETLAHISKGHAPFTLWIEADCGYPRSGIPISDHAGIIALATQIREAGHRFGGVLTHAGQSYNSVSHAEIMQVHEHTLAEVRALRAAMEEAGLSGFEISTGDTPTCSIAGSFPGSDEIRPGNFAFYDMQQVGITSCTVDDVAVAVACPVVSIHPERGEVIIHGGGVHFAKDSFPFRKSEPQRFGAVCLPEARGWSAPLEGVYVKSLSQEHGIISFAAVEGVSIPGQQQHINLKIGDIVCILPSHSCLTADVMGKYLTLDGNWIEMMPK